MKKLFLLLWCLMAIVVMNANPVTRSEALKQAQKLMPGKTFHAVGAFARGEKAMGNEAFYIFNADNGGFVVVSGDDRTVPIIGYSDKGELRQENIPENLRAWLDGYAEQLKAIEDGTAAPASARAYEPAVKAAIEPLIKTQWNQGNPYNLMVPYYTYKNDKGEEVVAHYVTGCVATALAQVMYYYRWPASSPVIPAYTTEALKVEVPELPATTFKWELMTPTYNAENVVDAEGASPGAQAVAELMRYVGQSVEMNYNKSENGGSGASISCNVMINTFGYSKNMYTISRGNYTVAEWENMIYQELAVKRPVLYDGRDSDGGHQFICDGYDGDGLFHINWGWGGSSDGYFVLSLANPDDRGIGGGNGSSGYAFGQSAILGFQPAKDGELEIPFIGSSTNDVKAATYTRESAEVDFVDVSTSGSYYYGRYSYQPTTTYPIEVGWALWQDGKVLQVLSTERTVIDNMDLNVGWYHTPSGPLSVSFGAGLPDGNYRLVQIWRPQPLEGEINVDVEWNVISTVNAIYLEIAGNNLNVRGANATPVTYTVDAVAYSGEMAQGTTNTATVTLTNTCDATQTPVYYWLKEKGVYTLKGQGMGSIEPGQTGQVNLTFSYETSGNFDVRITSDKNGDNVMWNGTLTLYALQNYTYKNITYVMNTGTKEAKVIKYTGSSTTPTIPATLTYSGNNYTVTCIVSEAFKEANITAISLPNTLKIIEPSAFYNAASLEEIDIPEGVETIGHHAFAFCWSLKKVSLPSTLTTIGNPAFYDNTRLKTLIVAMPEPVDIAPEVFYCWDRTKQEHFASGATLYVPAGSKEKYQNAVGWNQFSQVYEGVLKETTINGITYAFVTTESFADIIEADETVLKGKGLVIPGSITVDDKTYKVRKINDQVFYRIAISSLTIEPGLEEIGNYNFFNLADLQKVVIPEGVKTIGAYAFQYCYYLTDVSLPSTLESIGDRAFGNCTSLKNVVCAMENPVAINENVFQISNSEDVTFTTATLFIPIGSKEKYQATEGWKEFTTMLQGEVKELAQDGITYRCVTGEGFADIIAADKEALKEKDVTIPSTVTVDDKSYKVRKIEANVFSQVLMSSLTIEPGLEEIGNSAFWNCNGLKQVVIPEDVKTIGAYAFQYCYYLTDVSLPSTLESIGDKAFGNCTRLKNVVCAIENPCAINENVFQVINKVDGEDVVEFTTATLYIPEGTKEKYQAADGWNQFSQVYENVLEETTINGITYSMSLVSKEAKVIKYTGSSTTPTIPATLTYSGNNYTVTCIVSEAFKEANITAISLPNTLKIIEPSAFYNAASLEEIEIPEGVETIGHHAFAFCWSLKKVSLPSTLTTIGNPAFYDTSGLLTLIVAMPEPVDIAPEVFYIYDRTNKVHLNSNATLYVPAGSKEKYQNAVGWNQFSQVYENVQEETTINGITYRYITGEGVADIIAADAEAIAGKNLVIPGSITVDEKPYRVRKIEDKVFFKMSMTSLTIEPGLEEIGIRAFWNCNGLKQVVIPEGVKTIGAYAFQHCFYITELSLPSTLENIGDFAFGNLKRLTSVTSYLAEPFAVQNTVWTMGNNGDEGFTSATLTVPIGAKEKYQATDGWKNFSTIAEMAPDVLKGDANGDEKIDIVDVTITISFILGQSPEGFIEQAADVNEDGKVDIVDVTSIIDLILNAQ